MVDIQCSCFPVSIEPGGGTDAFDKEDMVEGSDLRKFWRELVVDSAREILESAMDASEASKSGLLLMAPVGTWFVVAASLPAAK